MLKKASCFVCLLICSRNLYFYLLFFLRADSFTVKKYPYSLYPSFSFHLIYHFHTFHIFLGYFFDHKISPVSFFFFAFLLISSFIIYILTLSVFVSSSLSLFIIHFPCLYLPFHPSFSSSLPLLFSLQASTSIISFLCVYLPLFFFFPYFLPLLFP